MYQRILTLFVFYRLVTHYYRFTSLKQHKCYLSFIPQTSIHSSTGSSVLTRCWSGLQSYQRLNWGKICFQAFFDCWQNSPPYGCRTEVSILLLAVHQRPLTVLRGCLLFFAMRPSHSHSYIMAAQLFKVSFQSLLLQNDKTIIIIPFKLVHIHHLLL